LLKTRARSEASSGAVRFREKFMGTQWMTSHKYLHPKFFHAIGRRVTIVRAERFVRTNTAMGCCFSLCESTPDVPENIIPDPVVRLPAAVAEPDERSRLGARVSEMSHPLSRFKAIGRLNVRTTGSRADRRCDVS
jgi:hypothetical protein